MNSAMPFQMKMTPAPMNFGSYPAKATGDVPRTRNTKAPSTRVWKAMII
jgi:hypothetical protein